MPFRISRGIGKKLKKRQQLFHRENDNSSWVCVCERERTTHEANKINHLTFTGRTPIHQPNKDGEFTGEMWRLPEFTSSGVSLADCRYIKKQKNNWTSWAENKDPSLFPVSSRATFLANKLIKAEMSHFGVLRWPGVSGFRLKTPSARHADAILWRQFVFYKYFSGGRRFIGSVWGALQGDSDDCGEERRLAQQHFNKTQRCSPPSDLRSSGSCRLIIPALMSLLILKNHLSRFKWSVCQPNKRRCHFIFTLFPFQFDLIMREEQRKEETFSHVSAAIAVP